MFFVSIINIVNVYQVDAKHGGYVELLHQFRIGFSCSANGAIGGHGFKPPGLYPASASRRKAFSLVCAQPVTGALRTSLTSTALL